MASIQSGDVSSWTALTILSELPEGRPEPALVVVSDGRTLVCGGSVDAYFSASWQLLNTFVDAPLGLGTRSPFPMVRHCCSEANHWTLLGDTWQATVSGGPIFLDAAATCWEFVTSIIGGERARRDAQRCTASPSQARADVAYTLMDAGTEAGCDRSLMDSLVTMVP